MSTERPTIYQPARYHDLDKDNVTVAQCSEQFYSLKNIPILNVEPKKINILYENESISKGIKDLENAATLLTSILQKRRIRDFQRDTIYSCS